MCIEAKIMKVLANTHNMFPIIVIGVVLLLAPFSAAYAASYTQDLTFETFDQSMWGSGASFIIDYSKFWGVSWNESVNLGGIVGDECWRECLWGWCWEICNPIPETGVEVWAATNGTVGLDFGFKLDGGSVNVNYPVGIELIYPEEAKPGDVITISSQYTVDPTAYFTTNFPEIQTYLDLVIDVYAGIGGDACIAGACVGGSVALDIEKTFELLAFNRDDDGKFRLLGDPVAGFQFGEPYDFDYGDVTVWIPDIETTGTLDGDDTLTSEGESDLLQLTADIDKIATTLAQAAGLPVPDLEGDIKGFIEYNLLDIHAGPDFDIKQQFSFDPDLMIRLDLGTGGVVEFPLGGSTQIVMPSYDLDLTPTFSIAGNTFSNDTLLGLGLAASISMLQASVPLLEELGLPGTIGPLYQGDWGFDLFDVSLFWPNNPLEFALLGFQDFQTAAFTVKVVPEPGTFILLGIGLISVIAMKRRTVKK